MTRWLALAFLWIGAADKANVPPSDEFEVLFNGRDFQGWLADPNTLAHWKINQGEIIADGKGNNLVSERLYRDFELHIDWKAEKGSTGGIYLRGRPRVSIGDPEAAEPISGGLSANLEHPSKPTTRADKPLGQWNTFRIELQGNVATIYLNDQLVTDKIVMENDFDRSRRIPVAGPIELQANGPITFRNVFLRPLSPSRPSSE
jgi:hypothetical protein